MLPGDFFQNFQTSCILKLLLTGRFYIDKMLHWLMNLSQGNSPVKTQCQTGVSSKNHCRKPTSLLNIPVEFCQHRKKKESCQRLLKNHANDNWTIVPVAVEQSWQWLLNNCASDCWTIVLATVEQLCQWLLNNRVIDNWTIPFSGVSVVEF